MGGMTTYLVVGEDVETLTLSKAVELSSRMSLDETEYRVRWTVAPNSESICALWGWLMQSKGVNGEEGYQ